MEKTDESGDEWNYTVPASTRLSTQTSERLDRYQEQEDIGKSEALRRTIRTGLDRELDDDEEEQETSLEDALLMLGIIFGIAAAVGYLSGGGNPDQIVWYIVVALLGGSFIIRFRNHD